jgi:hypothetical protein
MRAFGIALMAWAAAGGAAIAQDSGTAGGASSPAIDLPPIHYDLSTHAGPKAESLPEAATLDQLTFPDKDRAVAATSPASVPRAAPAARPRPEAKRKPRPAPPVIAAAPAGPPMSAWRRAYIARHGHQPPVPAR